MPHPTPPTTDPSLLAPQPLTRENLRKLTGNIAMNPTPEASTKTSSTGRTIRTLLQVNHILIDDDKIQEEQEYKDVAAWAEKIVNGKRHSPQNSETGAEALKTRKEFANRNERTFIAQFWPDVVHKSRHKLEDNVWRVVAWEKDGLTLNWEQPFRAKSIPEVDTGGNRFYDQLLAQYGRVANPVPDIAYGLKADSFTAEEMDACQRFAEHAGISAGMFHPALILEAKTTGGTRLVEEQCARGGAALVHANRKLLTASGIDIAKNDRQTNRDSAVFSIALVQDYANLYVHWAYNTEGRGVYYHMHDIGQVGLKRELGIVQLRGATNNILDWMTGERKTMIKALMRRLHHIMSPKPRALGSSTPRPHSKLDLREGIDLDDLESDEDELSVDVPTSQGKKRRKF